MRAFDRLVPVSAALAVVLSCGVAFAQTGAEPAPAAPAATPPAAPVEPKQLSVGDKAPALVIEHWVKGEPVKTFEKGKVYVVEFWATWCGPCIRNMPHLTSLQKKLKDKGVTIIGISSLDKNGIEDVRPFVEKRGDIMGYTVAVDKGRETSNAYMGATGRTGIPVAYIVDQKGQLAWYGHPMEGMDLVLDEILAGSFDATKHQERMTKFRTFSEQFGKATQEKRWDDALAALDSMKDVRPDLANDFAISRFAVLRAGKKDKEAAAKVRVQLEEQFKNDLESLRKLSEMLAGVPEPDSADAAAAIALAKVIVQKTESKDAQSLAVLAHTYRISGDWENAIKTQEQAITASPDDSTRVTMQQILDQIKADRDAATAPAPAAPADAPKAEPKNP